MVRASEPLVIEVDSQKNSCLYFTPLERRIRGRLGLMRTRIPEAMALVTHWDADVIPGQRLLLDLDAGTAAVLEPLHEADYSPIKKRIVAKGKQLQPAVEEIPNADVSAWLYYMSRAVACGLARIVSGAFPPKIEPPKRVRRVIEQAEGLVAENRDLRAQVAELRQGLADLRAMVSRK